MWHHSCLQIFERWLCREHLRLFDVSFWKKSQDPGSQGFTFQGMRFPHTERHPIRSCWFIDWFPSSEKNTSSFLRLEDGRLKPLTDQRAAIVSKDPPEVRQVRAEDQVEVEDKQMDTHAPIHPNTQHCRVHMASWEEIFLKANTYQVKHTTNH